MKIKQVYSKDGYQISDKQLCRGCRTYLITSESCALGGIMRHTIKKNKTYTEGRICPKCGAVLSIYNKKKQCSTHTVGKDVNPVIFGNPNKHLHNHIRLS